MTKVHVLVLHRATPRVTSWMTTSMGFTDLTFPLLCWKWQNKPEVQALQSPALMHIHRWHLGKYLSAALFS